MDEVINSIAPAFPSPALRKGREVRGTDYRVIFKRLFRKRRSRYADSDRICSVTLSKQTGWAFNNWTMVSVVCLLLQTNSKEFKAPARSSRYHLFLPLPEPRPLH